MFLLFGSTHVVKIKKTQESTPSILKRITEDKVYYLPLLSFDLQNLRTYCTGRHQHARGGLGVADAGNAEHVPDLGRQVRASRARCQAQDHVVVN